MRHLQDPPKPAAQRHPPAARHTGVEAGGVAKVPLLPHGPLRATGAYDQADGNAGDHAVQVGTSDGGEVSSLARADSGFGGGNIRPLGLHLLLCCI